MSPPSANRSQLMQESVFIGMGSNLAEPAMQLAQAARGLAAIDGVELRGLSSIYASEPLGYDDQPEFQNAVAALATTLAPRELLHALQRIEDTQGRRRSFRNAPRTLDLDILLFGTLESADPTLTLPHPRCHERAFVLLPLLELAPGCTIPGRGPARNWMDGCAGQRIRRVGAFPPPVSG